MNKPFDLIVFDWDGTLMDSAAAIVQAIQAACRDLEVPEPSEQAARQVIGLGLHLALQQAIPDLPEATYPQMVDRYRHHYLASDHQLTLFAGTQTMIERLVATGHQLAVATGKSRLGLNRALKHSGLERYFATTRCADECASKPDPQMLLEILEELDVPPARALMVGDTTHDLEMANRAGVSAVGVQYGAHSAAALLACAPLACLKSMAELETWLCGQ